MGGDGFEPPKLEAADLQSAPFGHSGNHPLFFKSVAKVLLLFETSKHSVIIFDQYNKLIYFNIEYYEKVTV